MRRACQYDIEVGRKTPTFRSVGLEDLHAVRRVAPGLDVRGMQAQLSGQFLRARTRGVSQRFDQSKFDAEIDQMDDVEAAAPLENARDLRIGGDLGVVLCAHCLIPSFPHSLSLQA